MSQVVDGDLVKVMSWCDNEWGYSSQLVREASRIATEMGRRVPRWSLDRRAGICTPTGSCPARCKHIGRSI